MDAFAAYFHLDAGQHAWFPWTVRVESLTLRENGMRGERLDVSARPALRTNQQIVQLGGV